MSLLSWSGRRDSNPRPPPWQGDVLPLNYFRTTVIIIANAFFIARYFAKKDKFILGTKKAHFRELLSWSGRRDSNPRPPPWQGDVLPLNYFRTTVIIIANAFFIARYFAKKDKFILGTKKAHFRELLSWSGRRDSNPRPPPWQGDVLPLNYFRDNRYYYSKYIFLCKTFLSKKINLF